MYNFGVIGSRLAVALLAGAIIGFERELMRKPAGIRTNALICAGAALYLIIGMLLNPDDLNRIVAQITTGVGFIGAGVIIHSGINAIGITTAATIWIVAALGCLIGKGETMLGLSLAICLVIVLCGLGRLETFILKRLDKRQ